MPLFDGSALVQPTFAIVIALGGAGAGNGTARLPISVPAAASFVGTSFDFQVLLLDAANPSGVAMSNAVEAWIG